MLDDHSVGERDGAAPESRHSSSETRKAIPERDARRGSECAVLRQKDGAARPSGGRLAFLERNTPLERHGTRGGGDRATGHGVAVVERDGVDSAQGRVTQVHGATLPRRRVLAEVHAVSEADEGGRCMHARAVAASTAPPPVVADDVVCATVTPSASSSKQRRPRWIAAPAGAELLSKATDREADMDDMASSCTAPPLCAAVLAMKLTWSEHHTLLILRAATAPPAAEACFSTNTTPCRASNSDSNSSSTPPPSVAAPRRISVPASTMRL
eukprot:1093958-Rhodomonas_salina.2